MLDGLVEIGQRPFLRLLPAFFGQVQALCGAPGNSSIENCRITGVPVETPGASSLFISDFSRSHSAESVRRITLHAKLIYCACKSGLLDFVLAHGEPVLCRYAPNPR
ncbi:hypothetical protein [Paraburkholderia dioscoreae]|uniref:Uncharacterized protein n=1 Tax=Paraburkholderia dioscoreae TaxID=2604047 RepID=A0A5Q4Z7H6_9BURK|nr:hypothetical protein [Paraburkholderia dioscoreae]VVD29595.1 protein of unknown function [Paraburkholderia dioscoreae]